MSSGRKARTTRLGGEAIAAVPGSGTSHFSTEERGVPDGLFEHIAKLETRNPGTRAGVSAMGFHSSRKAAYFASSFGISAFGSSAFGASGAGGVAVPPAAGLFWRGPKIRFCVRRSTASVPDLIGASIS